MHCLWDIVINVPFFCYRDVTYLIYAIVMIETIRGSVVGLAKNVQKGIINNMINSKMNAMAKGMGAAALVAAAAILPMTNSNTAVSADDNAKPATDATSWRAKTVDDVKEAVKTAGTTYKIQDGDTIDTIAQATGLKVDDIVKMNNITNPNLIIVGEEIRLNGSVAPAQSNASAASQASTSTAASSASVASAAPAQTSVATAPVSTGSFADAVNALNAIRTAAGLSPVSYDASLSATAQYRADMMVGNVDAAHFAQSYGHEVVAIGFGAGSDAVNAWYAETGMIDNGSHPHTRWVLGSYSRVGFGYNAATGTFVAEAQ